MSFRVTPFVSSISRFRLDVLKQLICLLYTSMEEVYSILSEKNLPYKILMQQPGSSQDKVLNEFKEDTNSVLLGRCV